MANSVVDSEFLLEWCEYFGQPQVWYNSYVPRECINSGLDYWNGGIVDYGFCPCFHYLSCCIHFVVLADLCYIFYVAGFPDFEGY